MKNKFFSILIGIFVIFFFYLTLGIWGIFEIQNHEKLLFKSKKNLEFHIKYSNKLHHLRDVNRWGENNKNYLYSLINFNNKNSKTILFQGDSWIESISEINNSNDTLKKFGVENKFNIINAGITSFAPSLMHVQYRILKTDFQINPELLVIYIDQTDIGDEHCRYKHNKVYDDNGKLAYVKREKYNKAVFDYSKIYDYSNLKIAGKLNTILEYPIVKTRYFLKRNIFQIKQILSKGFKNRNFNKCSFEEINKVLLEINLDAEKNFKNSLKEYLNYLENETDLEKIILVSFPHLNHYKKIYKVNVSDYIDQVIIEQNNDKFSHLNMSRIYKNKEKFEEMYKLDLASHLKDEYHDKIFLKKIISKISKN